MKRALFFIWPLLLIGLLFGIRFLTEDQSATGAGAKLYEQHCANCHMEDGQGLRGLIPPLAQADFVRDGGAELACGIVNGYEQPIVVNGRTYKQPMPGIEGLSATEITYLINYIKVAWGEQGDPVSHETVSRALDSCTQN